MKTLLTPNFTLEELCASDTAKKLNITNLPTQQAMCNLAALAHHVLQPLRKWWGNPIAIGSGYRCARLNSAVGGVSNSQHMLGEAADLCLDGSIEKGKKWYNWIKANCEFDQLIFERNPKTGNYWLHVSYRADGKNRKQAIPYMEKK